jgi:hypothetical protein
VTGAKFKVARLNCRVAIVECRMASDQLLAKAGCVLCIEYFLCT